MSVMDKMFVEKYGVWKWVDGWRLMLNYGKCEMMRMCRIIGEDKWRRLK
jgi:hypothetical protein